VQKHQTITECGNPRDRGRNPRGGAAVREKSERVPEAIEGQSGGIRSGSGRSDSSDAEAVGQSKHTDPYDFAQAAKSIRVTIAGVAKDLITSNLCWTAKGVKYG